MSDTHQVPAPPHWYPSIGGGRFGFLDDGSKVVELPAAGSVPALRFIDMTARPVPLCDTCGGPIDVDVPESFVYHRDPGAYVHDTCSAEPLALCFHAREHCGATASSPCDRRPRRRAR